jgi:Zn-dependent protease with chaperone function
MHITLILVAIGIACILRFVQHPATPRYLFQSWQRPLVAFLLPPMLLFTTAIAVLCMGTEGQMLGLPVGGVGYALAIGFLSWAGGLLLKSLVQGWRSVRQLQAYPQIDLNGVKGRLLQSPILFAAQVGFWQPQLVVSQGLLDTLSSAQLTAVLTHEQAHFHHRDTFWFLGLGWFRQMTAWLPRTDLLWQELLLLRELRADRWAAQQVDPLLLAESLLLVVQHPIADAGQYSKQYSEQCNIQLYAAFGTASSLDRLEERIEALLDESEPASSQKFAWLGLVFSFIPLLTMFFHT